MSVRLPLGRGAVRPVLGFRVLVAALVVAVLAGCASASTPRATAGATASGTATVVFHPFSSTGDLIVPVDDVVRGQCWTTSIAAPSADAYRCFQGNRILDPCFAPDHLATPVQLACLAAPWSRALMLQVTGRLPARATGVASRPWAFELANGVRCVASTGTVPAVAGVNLGYHCADGGDAALAGVQGARLAASYAASGATRLTTLGVVTTWEV